MTAVAVRLVRLHAASRRVPAALILLAACAAAVFAAGLAAITVRGPRAPVGG